MPARQTAAALALAPDGVLTRQALVDAGLDRCVGDRLVREGQAVRLGPSTYVLGPSPTHRQLVRAALVHGGPSAAVTGAAACRLLELTDAPEGSPVEIVLPRGVARRGGPLLVVQVTDRWPATRTLDGLPVVETHRAVVDAARRTLDLRTVRGLVLGAIVSGHCSADRLAAELAQGRPNGTALCRRALHDARRGAWSAPEAEVADVADAEVHAGRLPPFLLNPLLRIDGQVLGRPDGWFPGLGLGWEQESVRHHAGAADFDRTLRRHDDFVRHGLQLLHLTPRRTRSLGRALGDLLVDAVDARRRTRAPEPPGLTVEPFVLRAADVRRAA